MLLLRPRARSERAGGWGLKVAVGVFEPRLIARCRVVRDPHLDRWIDGRLALCSSCAVVRPVQLTVIAVVGLALAVTLWA